MPVNIVPKSANQGPLKARMRVVLMADDVIIADAEDFKLWNAVLSAISSGSSSLLQEGAPAIAAGNSTTQKSVYDAALDANIANTPSPDPISKFAREVGVEIDVLQGACAPSADEPYLHLDPHHWERMRRELPARGPKAIPPIVLALSMLTLWSRAGGLGPVTQSQGQAVLGVLGIRDTNPGRGLDGAQWLQRRSGGQVVLNPAMISSAVTVTKCFCTKDWSEWRAV
jgi:hypothetical protein